LIYSGIYKLSSSGLNGKNWHLKERGREGGREGGRERLISEFLKNKITVYKI